MSHDLRFLCSLLDYTLKTPDRNFTLVPLAASADYLYEVAYRKIPVNLSEISKYVNGHKIKRYEDGFRSILKQNKGDICFKNVSFC